MVRGGVGRSMIGLFLVTHHVYVGYGECFIVYQVFNPVVGG